MSAAQRKPAPLAAPTNSLSVGGLARRLGVPRQRIYEMVKRGRIKAEPLNGSLVITPEEASRVFEAATRVDTNMGSRLVFDFV